MQNFMKKLNECSSFKATFKKILKLTFNKKDYELSEL